MAAPVLGGNEKAYVADCLDSTWISSSGEYVNRFEAAFADFCGVKHAIACCNGTAALHLALLAVGIGPGDEVIVPTLTFVATANAVAYCGARPVFVDSDAETWNLNPSSIEKKITRRTKAIIAVHLYGHPAEMDPIIKIARRHDLFVVEDAAEAHGAEYKGKRVGSIGDISAFSFYGNKIITTGEGGMVVTNDAALAKKAAQFKGQGIDPKRRYWFPVIGYNYRMTNIAAAIGLAQLERIDWHLQRRLEIAAWYQEHLQNVPEVICQPEKPWAKHVYWMFSIVLGDGFPLSRDRLMDHLSERGVETRPIFHPMHTLPPYRGLPGGRNYPVADRIAKRGLSLPTWGGLGHEDVKHVSRSLLECLRGKKKKI